VGDAGDGEEGDDGSAMGERVEGACRHGDDPVEELWRYAGVDVVLCEGGHPDLQAARGGADDAGDDVNGDGGGCQGREGRAGKEVLEGREDVGLLYDPAEADYGGGVEERQGG